MPATNVFKISNNISLKYVASLTDCLATDWHAVCYKAKPKPGDNVMIMGTGGLGINAIQFLKMMGANAIGVDIVQDKLELAKKFGADSVINVKKSNLSDEINKITSNMGMDIVLEFVGTPKSMELSINCLKRGGKIVMLGYSPDNPFFADSVDIVHAEKSIIGSRANTKQDLVEVIRFLEQGKITPVITDEYKLEEVNFALGDLSNNKVLGRAIVKII